MNDETEILYFDKPQDRTMEKRHNFVSDLTRLINSYSIENGSNTPDFMLAEYLMGCLENFERTSNQRERWYK